MAKEVEENPFLNSLSLPARPVTNNRQYYHIPWDDSKPCLHIKFPWQDHRRRLYNANIIYKICERFVSTVKYSYLGTGHYLWREVAPKRKGLGKNNFEGVI